MQMRRRSMLSLTPLIAITGLVVSLWSGVSFADTNTPLPQFSLPTITPAGKRLTDKTFQGHVSLLNIWASWCSYCRREHSTLLMIKSKYHVPIYGIAYRDDPERIKSFLAGAGNPYTLVGSDWSGDVSMNQFDATGTPVTFIVDKHGIIRYRFVGSIDESDWNNELLPIVKKYEQAS